MSETMNVTKVIRFSKSQGPYVSFARLDDNGSANLMAYFETTFDLHEVEPKDPTYIRWMLKGFNEDGHKVTVTYFKTGTINVDNLAVKEIEFSL